MSFQFVLLVNYAQPLSYGVFQFSIARANEVSRFLLGFQEPNIANNP